MAATLSPRSFREFARSVIKNPPKPGGERETFPEPDDFSEDPIAPENGVQDFKDDARPGLSFSKAFVIVLAIHLLFIGGFYIFGAVKSIKGPQYAGVTATKETVQKDKKWLEDHPASPEPAAKVARSCTADPKETPKKETPVQHLATSGKKEPKPVSAKTKPPTTKPAVVAQTEVPPAPPVSEPEPDTPHWVDRAKAMLAANPPPPVPAELPVETNVETRRAVPVVNEAPVVAAPSPPAEASIPGGEYTLVSGDTLYAISRKAHVSYQEIAEANGIKDPRQLQVGQKLKIPSVKVTSL